MDDITDLRREIANTPQHGYWLKSGPNYARTSLETLQAYETRTSATFGDPVSLGLWAYATGLWIAGVVEAGVFAKAAMFAVVPMMLAYSGIVLFIAGVIAYRRANAVMASLFCSFAGFNASRGVLYLLVVLHVLPDGWWVENILGCLMESFAWIALSLCLATLALNWVMFFMMFFTFAGFLLTGAPYLIDVVGAKGTWVAVGHAGGASMVLAALFAYYGGTASIVNSAWRRQILPLGGTS